MPFSFLLVSLMVLATSVKVYLEKACQLLDEGG